MRLLAASVALALTAGGCSRQPPADDAASTPPRRRQACHLPSCPAPFRPRGSDRPPMPNACGRAAVGAGPDSVHPRAHRAGRERARRRRGRRDHPHGRCRQARSQRVRPAERRYRRHRQEGAAARIRPTSSTGSPGGFRRRPGRKRHALVRVELPSGRALTQVVTGIVPAVGCLVRHQQGPRLRHEPAGAARGATPADPAEPLHAGRRRAKRQLFIAA